MKITNGKDPSGAATSRLSAHWVRLVAQKSEHGWAIQLTAKQRGQLRILADKVGVSTLEVIEYAINNWAEFGHRAVNDSGVPSYPLSPHTGFLLAHYPSAITLMKHLHVPKAARKPEPVKLDEPSTKEGTWLPWSVGLCVQDQNIKDIEEMLAKFEAAGEPPPTFRYNSCGEVVYESTKKELREKYGLTVE